MLPDQVHFLNAPACHIVCKVVGGRLEKFTKLFGAEHFVAHAAQFGDCL